MSLHRANPKRDTNESAIVGYLRARGAMVTRVSGTGLPDLLVGWCGRWLLLECKAEVGTLTGAQKAFHVEALRRGLPLAIVKGWEDCKKVLDQKERLK